MALGAELPEVPTAPAVPDDVPLVPVEEGDAIGDDAVLVGAADAVGDCALGSGDAVVGCEPADDGLVADALAGLEGFAVEEGFAAGDIEAELPELLLELL